MDATNEYIGMHIRDLMKTGVLDVIIKAQLLLVHNQRGG